MPGSERFSAAPSVQTDRQMWPVRTAERRSALKRNESLTWLQRGWTPRTRRPATRTRREADPALLRPESHRVPGTGGGAVRSPGGAVVKGDRGRFWKTEEVLEAMGVWAAHQ